MDLVAYVYFFQNKCNWCIEFGRCECFHMPFQNVRELNQFGTIYMGDDPILEMYMKKHHQWLVMTKIKHQIILNKPMIVRRICTKAWNDTTFTRYRFPGIKILDDLAEISSSGSRGLQ